VKQLTAIIHQDEPDEGGFWATCLEVPGVNGQGETKEECLQNLREAVELLLETERAGDFQPNSITWKKTEADVFEKWRGRGKLDAAAAITDDYLRLTRDGDVCQK
jgi:predicted RNase H-like HicB family nuclease